MNWKNKTGNVALGAAALAVAVLVLFVLVKTKPEPEKQKRPERALVATTMPAERRDVRIEVSGFGTVEPKTDLQLVAQVSGRVTEMNPLLRVGEAVSSGTVLLQIDPRSYEITVRQARAKITMLEQEKKNLQAELDLAREDLEIGARAVGRQEKLLASESGAESALDVSRQALVNRRRQVQQLENQLAVWPDNYETAQATLDQALLNLEYTTIRAPFDGRVSERLVEAGQFVSVGTRLARLYDPTLMEIPVRLPLNDFHWIDGNGPSPAHVRLRVGGEPCEWLGSVSRLEGQVDQQTRTAGLIVEVDARLRQGSPPGEGDCPTLLPGHFVQVGIEGRTLSDVLVLPRLALRANGRVYVVAEGRLAFRDVEVLRSESETVYVRGPINEGEPIVVTPVATAVEGMKVREANDLESGREMADSKQPEVRQ